MNEWMFFLALDELNNRSLPRSKERNDMDGTPEHVEPTQDVGRAVQDAWHEWVEQNKKARQQQREEYPLCVAAVVPPPAKPACPTS